MAYERDPLSAPARNVNTDTLLIEDLVRTVLELKDIIQEDRKISFSEEEAAEELGIKLITLQRLRRGRNISYTVCGKKARYTRRHLQEYFERHTVRAAKK